MNYVEMPSQRQCDLLIRLEAEMKTVLSVLKMSELFEPKIIKHPAFDPILVFKDSTVAVLAQNNDNGKEGYSIGHNVHDPGVWRHPDGSGEPPSDEFAEDFFVEAPVSLMQVAESVIDMLFRQHLDNVIDGIMEERMMAEELGTNE